LSVLSLYGREVLHFEYRLHFTEDYWTAAGQRVLNVLVNGNIALAGVDPYALSNARYFLVPVINKTLIHGMLAALAAGKRQTKQSISCIRQAECLFRILMRSL
jgi:hypothetical protein